ncbi:hypothetical protein OJAV_G00236010 [Oryzias javanicus]|uniref:Solute carrier family 13 member 4 n=1 Tax=Oryzias javanicus TaxID=123683 RepID=A0A437BYD2_ORYJA|nr:hypothetical protein OJAV_G00236010 [Oryzias javanicus]
MRLEAAARMDLFRKLWRARKLILVVLIPLSLLPLPLIHPTSEACCAYVLMVTAVYWVSEAVPLGAAALVPAFLYPLFGVLKSSEVSASERHFQSSLTKNRPAELVEMENIWKL